jgi:hypothetical protein
MKHLADVGEAFRALSARAEQLCGAVGAEQMCRPRGAEGWSAAECLAHLAISANVYAPVWREAYDGAKQRGARGGEPYRMDFMGRLLNWSLEPGRFRMRTPARFQPVDCGSADQALEAFLKSQRMVLSFIEEGAEMPLDRMMIVSPINAKIRYSVWSSLVVLATHGRRHLVQAELAGGIR